MQAGGPNEGGSAIWSVDVSSSGERVVFGSGYPEMSIVCLHGKGKKEFEHNTGGIPGALKISKSRGEIIAGMVARRGLGNIICLSSRGKQVWQITTHKKIENLDVTAEGDVVCGTKDGTLLYLDRGGKVSWHKNLGLYKGPLATYFLTRC
jgi:outer membrane protein assembly factor BamB